MKKKQSKFMVLFSDWDVSKVTNMKKLFLDKENFNREYDISNWDVSNVHLIKI